MKNSIGDNMISMGWTSERGLDLVKKVDSAESSCGWAMGLGSR